MWPVTNVCWRRPANRVNGIISSKKENIQRPKPSIQQTMMCENLFICPSRRSAGSGQCPFGAGAQSSDSSACFLRADFRPDQPALPRRRIASSARAAPSLRHQFCGKVTPTIIIPEITCYTLPGTLPGIPLPEGHTVYRALRQGSELLHCIAQLLVHPHVLLRIHLAARFFLSSLLSHKTLMAHVSSRGNTISRRWHATCAALFFYYALSR